MINMSVFPVAIPTVEINGLVRERDDATPLAQAEISFPGLGGKLTSNATGNYSGSGFGSDSLFLIKVTSAAHHDTYQFRRSDRSLIQAGAITQEIVHNLNGISMQEITALAAEAGVPLLANHGIILGSAIEAGGKKENAQIFATDASGLEVGNVVYFDGKARPHCCLSLTTNNGGFLIFNLPPGDVFLKANAIIDSSGPTGKDKSSGSMRTRVFPDGVSLEQVELFPIQRTDQSNTLTLAGNVVDENGTKIGGASIDLLGVADPIQNSSGTGAYTIPLSANVNAVTPVLSNSRFIFRVDALGHVPTYQ